MKHICAILLSGLILTQGLNLEVFHDHESHHECAEDHLVGAIDACHMAIFHGHGTAQCDDHSHLLETELECALCMLPSAASEYVVSSLQTPSQIDRPKATFPAEDQADIEQGGTDRFLRGPPSLS